MTSPFEPRMAVYQRWLHQQRGLTFDSYEALWRWSVGDLPAFWQSIWDHFEIQSPTPHRAVLEDPRMPGARWFPGAQVNYAQQVLRHAEREHAAGNPAIVFSDETLLAERRQQHTSWPELARQVGALAAALQGLGVKAGDRVCAVLPNRPETVVAFLATASLGAVWSLCSPDMGAPAILDRFTQIQPKVLIAADAYRFGHVLHDRRANLLQLLAGLASLEHVLLDPLWDSLGDPAELGSAHRQAHRLPELMQGQQTLAPVSLPFDHPLWVVYSSGTTGLPKPIVHGHGGVMLEALKLGVLHNNLGGSSVTGERFHWYSATGWIMWNCQVGGLLGGSTICLYDGSPAGPSGAADWGTLWRFAGLAGCTFFGAGAAFYSSCLKAQVRPQLEADLSALRAIGSTGSPLSEDAYRWIWEHCPRQADGQPIWIACISGGTDFAGAFIAGHPQLPVRAGEMQCICLGADVQAWDEQGRALHDEVGELVCVQPMPSMPLYLWGDADGQRLHDSYFDMYPGVWRHGDWLRITPRGGAIIYGRSDATINRQGIRMGTAELYRAVEALPQVMDSLVVDLEYLGRPSWMGLFVMLREGLELDDGLRAQLKQAVRLALSPRHVPDEILQVPAVPRTLSGKKMELPVKKLLQGADPATVMNRDAMTNADAVDWFIGFAARRQAG